MADLLSANNQKVLIETLDKVFPALFVEKHPFLDRMARETAGGSGFLIPFQTSSNGGSGSTLEAAIAGSDGAGTFEGFRPKPAVAFGNAIIDHTQAPFMDTPQSPMDLATIAMKNASYNCIQDLAYKLFGTGHGDRLTIGTATSLGGNLWKIIPTQQSAAARFVLGDIVGQIVANYSSIDSGEGTVIGVNDIEGSLEIDVGSSGLTPAQGKHLGLTSELSTTVTGFAGVFGFCPVVSVRTNGVVGDTFLGVTRTAASNVAAVSGYAYSATGLPLLQAISRVAARMSRWEESTPDTVYVHPDQISKYQMETNQQTVNIKARSTDVDIFYSGFTVNTAAGALDVLPEPAMPSDQMLITKAKSWVYAMPKAMGKLAGPATGNQLVIPSYDHNVSRVSLMSSGFFGCRNLLASAAVQIDPVTL